MTQKSEIKVGAYYWVKIPAPGPDYLPEWTVGEVSDSDGDSFWFDVVGSDCGFELKELLEVGPEILPTPDMMEANRAAKEREKERGLRL